MTRPIGFSTGALAFGDFERALTMLSTHATPVVELSALREHELEPLMERLADLDLSAFEYVSIHAPSRFSSEVAERAAADALLPAIEREMNIVLHPDAILDEACWDAFGRVLCLENMDPRKRTGRTAQELRSYFERFPLARFCLDLAHARQVDGTMVEARRLIRDFGHRLGQVHMSETDAAGRHYAMSRSAANAMQRLAQHLPLETPIILESMVDEEQIARELEVAEMALRLPSEEPKE